MQFARRRRLLGAAIHGPAIGKFHDGESALDGVGPAL